VDVHVTPFAGCDDTFTFPSAIGCKEADASDDAESGASDASDDTSAPDGGVD
jgi:hypothetical protein